MPLPINSQPAGSPVELLVGNIAAPFKPPRGGGYFGTIRTRESVAPRALAVAMGRRAAAVRGGFAQPNWRLQEDLKGAAGELLVQHYFKALHAQGHAVELSTLVADTPDERPDVLYKGRALDVKTSAALIDGFTEREDRLLVMSEDQRQLYITQKWTGVIFARLESEKTAALCYYPLEAIEAWELRPGKYGRPDWRALPVEAARIPEPCPFEPCPFEPVY